MVKKNLKEKGFTLIEVIVTLAIIGVILIIALPRIGDLRDSNKDKKYEAYSDSVLAGAKLYVDSESKDMFGNYTSGCATIKYNDLKRKSLVKDFGERNVNVDVDNTYVEVRKANEYYQYTLSIILRDDDNKVLYEHHDQTIDTTCELEEDTNAPNIVVTPNSLGWRNKKDMAIKIKITDDYGLNKNIQIRYYWINSSTGTQVGDTYSYNYHNKMGKNSVSYTIPVKHNPDISGQYKLVVVPNNDADSSGVMDIMGNKLFVSYTSGVFKVDNTPPTCGNAAGSKTTWTNSNFSIDQYCSDAHSQCTDEKYRKSFSTTTKTSTITIKDNVGNTTVCPVNVYLDKDKPTCGTNTGSTKWTNQNRTVSVNCNDKSDGSGCSQSKFTTTFTSNGTTDKITIRDVAGNTNTCTVNKYIDKTNPSCGSVTGASTSWTKNNRTIKVGCSDNLSKCTSSSYSKTFSSTATTGTITIKDNANNSVNCSVNVYVDKTAPTTPTGGSIGGVSGSNKTGKIQTAASGSYDSHSGFSHYLYLVTNSSSTPSNTNSGFKTSMTFNRSCGTSYYAWAIAVDKVGNRSAVKGLGSTSDGKNSYSGWSGCSARCPTTSGTQTRTNSCALVTSGLSQGCSISCNKTMYVCRKGPNGAYLHWTTSTSCNIGVNCVSSWTYNTAVTVKPNTVNGFYEIISPSPPVRWGKTQKYIWYGCLSSSRNPADCASSCKNGW